MRSRSILFFAVTMFALVLNGCSKEGTADSDWTEANKKHVIISPSLDVTPEGKYLKIIYENFSADTIRKLKYQLVAFEGSKVDTLEREIILKERLKPQDQHMVDRAQTEKPVNYDKVEIGKVWIKK